LEALKFTGDFVIRSNIAISSNGISYFSKMMQHDYNVQHEQYQQWMSRQSKPSSPIFLFTSPKTSEYTVLQHNSSSTTFKFALKESDKQQAEIIGDHLASLLTFIIGFGMCWTWLGGIRYIRSSNRTAKRLAILSLSMWIMFLVVAVWGIASLTNSALAATSPNDSSPDLSY